MPTFARRTVLVGLFVCVWTAALAPRVWGQDDAPEVAPWLELTIEEVDPAMLDEYMAVQRDLTALLQDDVPWRHVSRTAVFGNTYRFLFLTPGNNLASFDRFDGSDARLAALVRRVQRCITSRVSYAVRTMSDFDHRLPDDEAPGLMVVNLARVAAGREQDYLDVMTADFFPHFKEAAVHYESGALTFGGEAGFLHLFHVENFAELDRGSPVVAALGPEAAQAVTAKLAGIMTRSEQWLSRLVPELSHGSWSESETESETGVSEREPRSGRPASRTPATPRQTRPPR
jgi:hypothetical protein